MVFRFTQPLQPSENGLRHGLGVPPSCGNVAVAEGPFHNVNGNTLFVPYRLTAVLPLCYISCLAEFLASV